MGLVTVLCLGEEPVHCHCDTTLPNTLVLPHTKYWKRSTLAVKYRIQSIKILLIIKDVDSFFEMLFSIFSMAGEIVQIVEILSENFSSVFLM